MERWQIIGIINGMMVVQVAHAINHDESDNAVVRIISARKAEKRDHALREYMQERITDKKDVCLMKQAIL